MLGLCSKVVLDLGTRTGLSPRRVRFQHQHIKSLRRPVHGRCEARRSAANNNHVTKLCLIDRVVEAEAICDLLIGWVSKRYLIAANHNRHIRSGDVEMIQQILDTVVMVKVDVRVRMAVARQKLFDA